MPLKTIIIYIDKKEKQKRLQIRKKVSKILATYPKGILTEVEEKQLGVLKEDGFNFEVQENINKIKLAIVNFENSEAPIPPKNLRLSDEEVNKNNYWIVQFIGPVKSSWSKKIHNMGGTVKDYIPENAFLVAISAQVIEKISKLPFVRWVGLYQPAFKINPVLVGRKGKIPPGEIAKLSIPIQREFKHTSQGNLIVVLHDLSCLRDVSEKIRRVNGRIIGSDKKSIRISFNPSNIDKIAKIPCVAWIEPYGVPELSNNVANGIIGVQQIQRNHGLNGNGQVIGVADSGLDTGVNDATMHGDFQGRIINIHDLGGDGADDAESGHGTHVTGSILGTGKESDRNIRGMAYSSRLIFQAIGQLNLWGDETLNGIPNDLNDLFQQAYDVQIVNGLRFTGARIHNNSWGTRFDPLGNSIEGTYTSSSEQIDQFIWDHKYMTILFAAGNYGTDADGDGIINQDSVTTEASAKNCITVGATESDRDTGGIQDTWGNYSPVRYPENPIRDDWVSDNPEGLAAFSSRGPTDDNRIKPDVVAPGTNILSTRSSLSASTGWGLLDATDPLEPYYMFRGGTSMATPLTAGVVALIRQYVTKVCRHSKVSAALLKALLIHGAAPIEGQHDPSEIVDHPDNNQGWGRVNLEGSIFPEYPNSLEFRDNRKVVLGTGESKDYIFKVVNGKVPFRATLVWTDYPSTPIAGGGLVNTLRLEVTPPLGRVRLGAPDNNNVQQVNIERPGPGLYALSVRGINIPTQLISRKIKQDFALVVTGSLDFIDVYVRDSYKDDGIKPLIKTLLSSPDIWISAVDDPQSEHIEDLRRLDNNKGYVFVKVHNRGSSNANDTKVRLYIGISKTSKPPTKWTKAGIKVGPLKTNVQSVDVPNRMRTDGETITKAYEVTFPSIDRPLMTPYVFLGAVIDHKSDLVLYPPKVDPAGPIESWNVHNSKWDNNIACKRLKINKK